jgi:hypothetical protein
MHLSKEAPTNPPHTSTLADTNHGIVLSQDGLHLPDLSWTNNPFFFPDFMPSHFLDTDMSLCDLFQQIPAQEQPDVQEFAGPVSDLVAPNHTQIPQCQNSISHNELHDNINLQHPPRIPTMDDQLDNSNLDKRSDTANCSWAISPSDYKIIENKLAKFKLATLGNTFPSKGTLAISKAIFGNSTTICHFCM